MQNGTRLDHISRGNSDDQVQISSSLESLPPSDILEIPESDSNMIHPGVLLNLEDQVAPQNEHLVSKGPLTIGHKTSLGLPASPQLASKPGTGSPTTILIDDDPTPEIATNFKRVRNRSPVPQATADVENTTHHVTPSRPVPSGFQKVGRKRRKVLDLTEDADEEDDVLVINELPPSAAQRSRDLEVARRARQGPATSRHHDGMTNVEHWRSLISAGSPDSFASPRGHRDPQAPSDRATASSRQHLGSIEEPIDVDLVNMNGEGPSRPQVVNGYVIGNHHNGRYIPYERPPYTPIHASGSAHYGNTESSSGPHHLYNGTYAPSAYAQALASSLQYRSIADAGLALSQMRHREIFDVYNRRVQGLTQDHMTPQSNSMSDADLKSLLENIKETDIPPELRINNPVGLTKTLMEHQRVGLTWLKAAEEGSSKGGILADAMGLGKTIQAISLMLTRPSDDVSRRSTLVVAPVALLRQWKREIDTMTSPTPSVYIHHGPKKILDTALIRAFDVVLTSFNTIGSEEAQRTRYSESLANMPNSTHVRPSIPMLDIKWYRVILDEAHFIKNKNTRAAKGCGSLEAVHRWALTGTPMQNSVDELYSLISFLRIKPYNDFKIFAKDISKPLMDKKQEQVATATRKLQAVLSAIMLRRTKDSKIDGKAILELPAKNILVRDVTMAEEERTHYTDLEGSIRHILSRTMRLDKRSTGSNMLVLLLKLRQTCDHSLLSGGRDLVANATTLTKAEGVALAKTLRPEVVQRIKTTASEGFDCAVCLDVMTTGITILVPCGHVYCGECVMLQLESCAERRAEDHEDMAKCPQCRVPFDQKHCVSLSHFLEAHCPEQFADPGEALTELKVNMDDKASEPGIAKLFLDMKDKGKQKLNSHGTSFHAMSEKFQKKFDANISDFEPSAKIKMILSILFDVRDNKSGEKTIVFSQFTSFLDLVEIPLHHAGVNFLRYDGSLDANKRNDAIVKFEDDPSFNVLLVSLKAGNVGLNLTCANHVILSEPFWNPYVEDQAVDRAHRIGQTREVFVYKLIIQDSVESRVLTIQNKKRQLIESAMDPTQSAAIAKLGKNEIAFLFGLGGR